MADKKEKKEKKNKKKARAGSRHAKSKARNWKRIDTMLFVVIVFSLSAIIMVTAIAEEDEPADLDYQNTDEYSSGILHSVLSGTCADENYTDHGGSETVYSGWSVKRLIIEDIKIRQNLGPYKAPANTGSLENGIERRIKDTLDDLVSSSATFLLNLSWTDDVGQDKESFFKINGKNFNKVAEPSKPVSSVTLTISTFDPDRTEVGALEIEVTLEIYDI